MINIINERLNAHETHITVEGFRIGEFACAYFGYFKDDVLKEMPRGYFGLFVDAWSLCAFCKMDYSSQYSFLVREKRVRGRNFKTSGEDGL